MWGAYYLVLSIFSRRQGWLVKLLRILELSSFSLPKLHGNKTQGSGHRAATSQLNKGQVWEIFWAAGNYRKAKLISYLGLSRGRAAPCPLQGPQLQPCFLLQIWRANVEPDRSTSKWQNKTLSLPWASSAVIVTRWWHALPPPPAP